jgi:DNA (cytosine-5)-methyltransferase 1
VEPAFAVVENVTALLDGWIGIVLRDLAEMGYDATWGVFPASSVGSPHHRERVFLVAHPHGERWREEVFLPLRLSGEKVPQATKREFSGTGIISGAGTWSEGRTIESAVLGVDVRDAHGVDRLKAIGNGQVPAVARLAWETLT